MANKRRQGNVPEIAKGYQMGIRWQVDYKAKWEEIAQRMFRKSSADLARTVMEEFMVCFLSPQELERMGLLHLHQFQGTLELALQHSRLRRESMAAARHSSIRRIS